MDTDGVSAADVVLLTRSPDKLADLATLGAHIRHGDFAGPDTLPAASAAGAAPITYTSYPNPDLDHNPASVMPDHAATEAATSPAVSLTFLRNTFYSEHIGSFSARNPLTESVFTHNFGEGPSAFVSREDCTAATGAAARPPAVARGRRLRPNCSCAAAPPHRTRR